MGYTGISTPRSGRAAARTVIFSEPESPVARMVFDKIVAYVFNNEHIGNSIQLPDSCRVVYR